LGVPRVIFLIVDGVLSSRGGVACDYQPTRDAVRHARNNGRRDDRDDSMRRSEFTDWARDRESCRIQCHAEPDEHRGRQ
jgi:hypothetical protein